MKKICLLFLSSFIFLASFAQIGSSRDADVQSQSFSGSTSFGISKYLHCGVCGKWHYAPQCSTPPPTPTPTPIDGGVSLLLVAGAAYGAKRFRGKQEGQR